MDVPGRLFIGGLLQQFPLSVIVPVKKEDVVILKRKLQEIGRSIGDNPYIDFKLSPSTHFARFVILDADNDACRLYFSSNHDRPLEEYAAELSSGFGAGLDYIFVHCFGYISGTALNASSFYEFLKQHMLPTNVFWNATPGVAVIDVRGAEQLRNQVQEALDEITAGATEPGPLTRRLPTHLQRSIAAVLTQPKLPHYSRELAARAVTIERKTKDDRGPFFQFLEWYLGVRPRQPSAVKGYKTDPELSDLEDLVAQNQITVVTPIAQSRKHRIFVPILFWFVNQLLKWRQRRHLVGIPTIHFARWVIIDGGENMLFESNYDGGWDSYIDDFVDYASSWMNSVWMNCVGFPEGGTRDVEHFKKYIRDHQVPAQVFYSAYRNTSMKNKLADLALTDLPYGYLHPKGAVERFIRGVELDPDVKPSIISTILKWSVPAVAVVWLVQWWLHHHSA